MIINVGDVRYEVAAGWGGMPEGWNFADAVGVAIGKDDLVHVLTRGQRPTSPDHPVLVFDRDGRLVRSFGDGVFTFPHAISLDAAGNVFCVDSGDHTVRKFSTDGKLLMTLGTSGVPSDTGMTNDYRDLRRGGGPPFNMPTKLAVAPGGDLFVSDGYGNCRIHHFSADGQLLGSWGEVGTGPGQFMLVHAVWALGDGRLLVCDRENNRVQVFSPDGKYLQEWTDLARPDDLWVDADGLVYVAELGERSALFPHMTPPYGHDRPGRVSVLNLDGDLVRRWGGDDPYATGSFFAPHGIAVDSRGNVYVSEVLAATDGGKGIVDFERKHALTKFARV